MPERCESGNRVFSPNRIDGSPLETFCGIPAIIALSSIIAPHPGLLPQREKGIEGKTQIETFGDDMRVHNISCRRNLIQ